MKNRFRTIYAAKLTPSGGESIRRVLVAITLGLGLALPVHADVTLKQRTDGKGLGISGSASGYTYIKGNKMRSDVVMGDTTHTTIFDVDAQKMYVFDSKKKQADVWDMILGRGSNIQLKPDFFDRMVGMEA